ncbi:hypothetical protein [Streptomyces camelliae]|uniref:Barstar (barnase inhibitor) domain-containing protein n=1 Tax=Streptomyces camelliae TaxID=3004093 RepID=A0ABY7NWB7_9ACTN|nr:hypothetical protein [Streptomyces sp. HUAS 2-6]WBO61393.1 hypothetical protein O1G22_00055 [Streptomyces sp. HUAS 2-6]
MTFIDDVLQGRATIDDFDSYGEAWHNAEEDLGEFHDYVGLLWPEYALWATDHDRISGDDVLEYVIEARRRKVGFLDYLAIRQGSGCQGRRDLPPLWLVGQGMGSSLPAIQGGLSFLSTATDR